MQYSDTGEYNPTMSEEAIKGYIKQVRKEANEDMKLHLGALNEMHKETLKTIQENFIIVNRKLDLHAGILDSHTKILDSHTKILDSHTNTLNSHTEMLGELKVEITEIKDMLKNKADKKEVFSLVKRVAVLEAAKH